MSLITRRTTLSLVMVATLVVTSVGPAGSSEPKFEWEIFTGILTSAPVDAAVGPDGSIYLVGRTQQSLDGENPGGQDGFVRKYSPTREIAWTRQIRTPLTTAMDRATAVAVSPNGHDVYVVGCTDGYVGADDGGSNQGSWDIFLHRYRTADGALIMASQYGTSARDCALDVLVTGSGAVYIAGYTEGTLAPAPGTCCTTAFITRHATTRNAPGGMILWTRQFGTTSQRDSALALADARDGTVYVSGETYGSLAAPNAGGRDAFVRRYTSDGYLILDKQFGGPFTDDARDIAVAADGGLYVTGGWGGATHGEPFLRRYDSNGSVWTIHLPRDASEHGQSVAVLPDGSALVLSFSNSASRGMLTRVSPLGGAGSPIEIPPPPSSGRFHVYKMIVTTDRSIYLAGDLPEAGEAFGEAYIRKYSIAQSPTVGLVDPSQGQWHLRNSAGAVASFYFGNPGDYPIMGDWNCNGIDTPGMYRQSDGYVYLRNTNTQGPADIKFFFGNPGDVPIAGDFNNDGCDTVSIYRPSNQTFYIINALGQNDGGLGAAQFSYVFGNPGDKPFTGDFNGNGVTTVGLHREATGFVYFRNSHTQGNADAQFFFGDPNDRFITGDWNVNGTDTPGIFRPGNTTFYFRYTNTQGNADAQFTWGQSGWLPVSGHFGLG